MQTLREHRHNQEVLHQQLCAQRDLLLAAQQGGAPAPGLAAALEHGSASAPVWMDALERGGNPPEATAAVPGAPSWPLPPTPLLCTSSPVVVQSSSPLSDGSADIIDPTPSPLPPPQPTPLHSAQQAAFGSAASLAPASFMQQDPQNSIQHGFRRGGGHSRVPFLPGRTVMLTASDISSSFPAKHVRASQRELHTAIASHSVQSSASGAAAAGFSEGPLQLFSGGLQPTGSGGLQLGSGSLDTLLGAPLFSSTTPVQPQPQPRQQSFSLPPLPMPPSLHNQGVDGAGSSGAVRYTGGAGHISGGFSGGIGFGSGAGGATHFQQPWPAATVGNPLADCATLMEQVHSYA